MDFYIVIPAHNEEDSIRSTLQSLCDQTLLPKKLVVVNDNSLDSTSAIVAEFTRQFPWIKLIDHHHSSTRHLPGSKIINAFYEGYNTLDENYDIICKFDADLIFPPDYLEKLAIHFNSEEALGMASGFCYIEKNNQWVLEDLTRKDHIRGALKAYRRACFLQIGKLKPAMGWDTMDELLAKYYDWKILTDPDLKVKHLKPTGASYNEASKYLQGEAMYKMRYGFIITLISALKLSYKKRKPVLFKEYMAGFFKAKKDQATFLVTSSQGKFIRKIRWQGMIGKFNQKDQSL